MTAPTMPTAAPQTAPAPQALTPPTPPWTPFAEEPMDAEPPIAAIRKRRLSLLMTETEYAKFSEPWKQTVRDAYWRAAQAIQAAQQHEVDATANRPSPSRPADSDPAPAPGSEGLVAS